MKARKFENVQLNDVIIFQDGDKRILGVVTNVLDNKFVVRAHRSYVKQNNVMAYHYLFYSFFKTGTKTSSRYTYGNAIEINA
jgi:hypothetical protein